MSRHTSGPWLVVICHTMLGLPGCCSPRVIFEKCQSSEHGVPYVCRPEGLQVLISGSTEAAAQNETLVERHPHVSTGHGQFLEDSQLLSSRLKSFWSCSLFKPRGWGITTGLVFWFSGSRSCHEIILNVISSQYWLTQGTCLWAVTFPIALLGNSTRCRSTGVRSHLLRTMFICLSVCLYLFPSYCC